MDITDLYAAAANAGLLTEVTVGGETVLCEFRAPDESLLDNLVLSTEYRIRYPTVQLPNLTASDTVVIATQTYQVREVRALDDGSERQATLTKL